MEKKENAIGLIATYNGKTQDVHDAVSMLQNVEELRVNIAHIPNPPTLEYQLNSLDTASRKEQFLEIDLAGEKIRNELPVIPVRCHEGAIIEVVEKLPSVANDYCLRPEHTTFVQQVSDKGTRLVLDDGKVIAKVTGYGKYGVRCEVLESYVTVIDSKKGIDAPEIDLGEGPIPEKDLWTVDVLNKRNWRHIASVSKSYAQRIAHVLQLRQEAPVWVKVGAKLENKVGVDKLRPMAQICKRIIVPRGDLKACFGFELPEIEKQMITEAHEEGAQVEVATGLFDSLMAQDCASQSELSALNLFMKMLVRKFWIVESANHPNPSKLCKEARRTVEGIYQKLFLK